MWQSKESPRESEQPLSVRAYLAFGSNVGDRRAAWERARAALDAAEGGRVLRVSSLHETAPVGGPQGQGTYLNAALEIETTLSPRELLAFVKRIEAELGRVPRERWGAREADLDILLYGDRVVREADLEIPHPRMHERWFVLAPLAEIAPDAAHPILGKTVARMLADLTR